MIVKDTNQSANPNEVSSDQLATLNADELKIYNSILRAFPATSPASAFNVAIQGGVRFQFQPS